jgi:Tfp pilus assembly protein PilE
MTTRSAHSRNASRRFDDKRRAGVTMVQTAALIALVGSLIAVAVPTFLRTVRRSKVAEAATELERLHAAVATYYTATHGNPGKTHCLPSAPAGPTPAVPSSDPIDVVFGDAAQAGAATWTALGYQPLGPVRFSYSMLPTAPGCDPKAHGPIALLRAQGDLDNDGEHSLFERNVVVDRDHHIVPSDALLMRDRVE